MGSKTFFAQLKHLFYLSLFVVSYLSFALYLLISIFASFVVTVVPVAASPQ